MAFADKYVLKWVSPKGVSGIVRIQKDGYAGQVYPLRLVFDGLDIDYKFSDWFEPIVGQSCSLSILNDASTFFAYEDLMSINEREFKIIIDASTSTSQVRLFDGWINSDTVEIRYLQNSEFRITGSNYLSKLDYTHPTIVDTIQKPAILNILDECLRQTGKDSSIYVLNRLEPSIGSFQASNQTLFNRCAVDTELFWEDNINRQSSLETMKTILRPFDSYVYWWDKNWYVVRYADAYSDVSTSYVGYKSNPSTGYASTGNVINVSTNIPSISDYKLANRSQMISMTPGLKTLDIKLDQHEYLNLSPNDFRLATPAIYNWTVTYPEIRKWNYYQDAAYNFPGYNRPFLSFDVSSGFGMPPANMIDSSGMIGKAYNSISSSIYRYGWPINGGNDKDRACLSTAFKATIENELTTLKITWKFAPITVGSGGPTKWDYRLRWTMRIPTGGPWITYNVAGEYWEAVASSANAINYIAVGGDSLDKDTYVKEVSVTVPIGDVSGMTQTGDQRFIFNMMGEDIKTVAETDYRVYGNAPIDAFYGDFVFAVSNTKQNNTIRGEISNNTLNKKEINISVFDIKSLNSRNGVYSAYDYNTRTELWTDRNRTNYLPISRWLIKDMFSLYNKNRRSITSDVLYGGFLKPFSPWKDTQDPSVRSYLLTSYNYKPTLDKYTCRWDEWSSDAINI